MNATIAGPPGVFLELILKINVFQGAVDGGTVSAFLRYTTSTHGSPDCGELEGCRSEAGVNGTRPPAS